MRAIDANVLLRYLLRDQPDQFSRAIHLIESEEPLGVTAVALAEVAWVLPGPMGRHNRPDVASALIRLLGRVNLFGVGFEKEDVMGALLNCLSPSGAADLGDAIIAGCARSSGIDEIYSFDQGFDRTGLTSIQPV